MVQLGWSVQKHTVAQGHVWTETDHPMAMNIHPDHDRGSYPEPFTDTENGHLVSTIYSEAKYFLTIVEIDIEYSKAMLSQDVKEDGDQVK